MEKIINDLKEVGDITWGMYAFSRDILRHKADFSKKKEMITKAIQCGYEKADEMIAKYGTVQSETLAKNLSLKVRWQEKGQISDYMIFALFTSPNQITIMQEPIKKAADHDQICAFISKEQIRSILLGHEIFHYLEEQDKTIYTRTEKIELWSLPFFKNRTTIRAVGEIAGMYFTKKLNHLDFCPFMLDVLLYFAYDPTVAYSIYQDIMELDGMHHV